MPARPPRYRMRFLLSRTFAAAALVTGLAVGPASPPLFSIRVPATERADLADGTPWATAPDGLRCGRLGNDLRIRLPDRSEQRLSMADLARTAIERDVLRGKWDGKWDSSLLVDTGIVFDTRGRAYTLIVPRYSNLRTAALLWSVDGCRTWRAAALAGINATIEKADGFNDRSGPPSILSYDRYGAKSNNRLWLEVFRATGADLAPARGSPFTVAEDSLLVSNHSGGGNASFSTPRAIFVVYPTTDRSAPGTQAMARQFDRRTLAWRGPARAVGRSTTKVAPDAHDLPSITMGPDRRPVVVVAAHHATFRLFVSRRPGSVIDGWSPPETLGAPSRGREYGEYSYPSLNMSRRGVINIVARSEGRGGNYDLVQLRRTPDGSWTGWPGDAPHRLLVAPGRLQYVAWRQHVTQAPDGTLYLSFAFYPNQLTPAEATRFGLGPSSGTNCLPDTRCWFNDAPTLPGRTLVSRDDGATWN